MLNPLKKIALVTGANKGIGFEVVRQLAASGCTVLLGARYTAPGEEAAATLKGEGCDVRFLVVDLDDPSTIVTAAREIEADFGHLDILVNNAGVAAPGDGLPSSSSLDAIERDFRVNFLGTVAVTQACFRCCEGLHPRTSALNMLTVQLAYELRDPSIKVNSADPGYTATDLNQHRGSQTIPEGVAEMIRLALRADGPTGTFSNTQGIVPGESKSKREEAI
jgi:NAD(P)-dependent dehydrogenase (short-subunit alcohol dehydrogenase family)